jgi:hypothetical protein
MKVNDLDYLIPDKHIVAFPIIPNEGVAPFDMSEISTFLELANKTHKRDWFTPHFYKCLPLSIANMQGLIFKAPFELDIFWNGGNETNDLEVVTHCPEKYNKMNFVYFRSEFGHGILTVHFPLILRTPPGINLMVINPPNYPTPGLSNMNGVVETDNLRFTFTINLKVDLPNTQMKIFKNAPLAGIIPIPRYFCDSFKLVNSYSIFDKDIIEEEKRAYYKQNKLRDKNNSLIVPKSDKFYYNGKDIFENKFKDHQLPTKTRRQIETNISTPPH